MADNNQQEKEFSIQPIDDNNDKDQGKGFIEAIKSKVAPHTAAPGPAQSHDHSEIPEEGTKEERLAKAKELNK